MSASILFNLHSVAYKLSVLFSRSPSECAAGKRAAAPGEPGTEDAHSDAEATRDRRKRKRSKSRRALALIVTISVSGYRKRANFGC